MANEKKDNKMNPFNDGKLYEKVGRRYKPVRDIHAYDGLSEGCWLVQVDKGCTSIRHTVNPDNAAIEHAAHIAEDKLVKIIAKHSEARLRRSPVPLTKKEQRAVKAYYDIMGKDKTLYFEYPAIQEIAKEIINELLKADDKFPTLEGRLNQPRMTTEDAVKQLSKTMTLSPTAQKILDRSKKNKRKHKDLNEPPF